MPPSRTTDRPRFAPYADTGDRPNIVVDGSPNAATVLTLSHWPGLVQPPGCEHDLSAGMAFRYLDHPPPHARAEVVTNNHFDQDGLVGVLALSQPDEALRHRQLLLDLAAAGDFGTYRHRAAARASMAVSALADLERSPLADRLAGLGEAERVGLLYQEVLPLTIPLATEPERFRPLWAEEDARLTAAEAAISSGRVTIDDRPDVDLAVIRLPGDGGDDLGGGHRFGHQHFGDIHPMALNNASPRLRQLIVAEGRFRYVDRYETWVQYRSVRPRPRVDLAPLAEQLDALETGSGVWRADPPSALTPELVGRGSSLTPAAVVAAVEHHLRTAPAAWDPFRPR